MYDEKKRFFAHMQFEAHIIENKSEKFPEWGLFSLRIALKTSRLLNGCFNQLSYESNI